MTRRAWIVAIASLVLCARTRGPAQGAAVMPPQTRPQRIISVVPAVTEMLFAIGAGAEVVGVSSYDRFPAETQSRPKVGALIDPDVERILSLRPDLVVVYGTQGELQSRLTRAGIPQFDYEHAGLADITATIRRLGARIGRAAEAARVADGIDREIAAIRKEVAGRARPRTMLVFGREPGALRGIYASGGYGFMHDMLAVAGGDNVFADIPRQSVQVSTEMVLARAPEVILEVQPPDGMTPDRIAREIALWSALPAVTAVRAKRTYLLANEVLMVPGPRVADGIRLMAAVLHPPR